MATVKLKGNICHTSGDLPKVGSSAPAFTLVKGDLQEFSSSSLKGKRWILYTAPSLDTSVCAASSKKLGDWAKKHPNVPILIASGDLPFAQARICGTEKIEHVTTLSMMRGKEFAKEFGVLLVDGPLQGLCTRACFVVDEQGKVLYRELVDEITDEPNYDALFQALE